MEHDSNAAIWKSDEIISEWAASADDRERTRGAHWRTMAALLPFEPDERFTFLDLGAGTGAAARAILDAYPASTALLADYSTQMIDAGVSALAPYGGRFAYVEFDMAAGEWPDTEPSTFDAVVTSLCIHHMPDERKQALFAEIFDRLVPGGWYLNYDPVTAPDPVVAGVWQHTADRGDHDAAHTRAHRSPAEQARFENHVRYMIPLDQQLGYLRAAGFEGIDVFWKHLENVIYGGRRPHGHTDR